MTPTFRFFLLKCPFCNQLHVFMEFAASGTATCSRCLGHVEMDSETDSE